MVTVSIMHTASKPAIQRFFIAVPLSFLGFVLIIFSSHLFIAAPRITLHKTAPKAGKPCRV